jgi:hypothetical protein
VMLVQTSVHSSVGGGVNEGGSCRQLKTLTWLTLDLLIDLTPARELLEVNVLTKCEVATWVCVTGARHTVARLETEEILVTVTVD